MTLSLVRDQSTRTVEADRSAPALVTGRAAQLGRSAFLLILTMMLAAFGSEDALPLDVAATALFALTACVLVGNAVSQQLKPVVIVSLLMTGVLSGWIVLQSVQITGRPAISAASADSLAAIVPITLPFAVFIIALGLWPTQVSGLKLLRLLGVIGAAFACFGLAQLALSPEKVLFVRPSIFRGSLTGPFLDRDSAAILLASIAVLLLVRTIDLLRRAFRRQDRDRDLLRLVVVSVATLLVIGALLLTKSQTGIGAATVGLALSAGLAVALANSRQRSRSYRPKPVRQIAVGIGVGAATALTMGILAARTLDRDSGDINATCQLPGLIRMLVDNWLLGTGASTFATTSPAYANAECGISQAALTTHSGFLEGWITLGLPFVVLVATAVVVLAIVLIRGLANRRRMRWVPIVGVGTLTVILTASASDSAVHLPGLTVLLAALLAPICTICLRDSHAD